MADREVVCASEGGDVPREAWGTAMVACSEIPAVSFHHAGTANLRSKVHTQLRTTRCNICRFFTGAVLTV